MITLSAHSEQLLDRLQTEPAIWVSVSRTQGSVPREPGAWMAVFKQAPMLIGTIGGGQLEAQAIAHAQALLGDPGLAPSTLDWALGPSLGQCCGGRVELQFERIGPEQITALRQRLHEDLPCVALFGGGHVGHALVHLLLTLPYALVWIDSRDEVFPHDRPTRLRCEHSQPVEAAVDQLPAGSRVLIMSFSHAEDLDIVNRCLLRQRRSADLPYVGLIGSATKWAVFRRRLQARGFSDQELDHITCPIGLPGIEGKEPAVIAVAVAAQLLRIDQALGARSAG